MSVEATPKKSVRRRSAELGVSQSSVHRILRHDLKMKPYHISVHHGLTPENALQRRTMCAYCLVLKTSERGARLFEIGVVQ